MRPRYLVVLCSVLALAFAAQRAMAQDPTVDDDQDERVRVDLSASATGLMATPWSDLVVVGSISSATGVLEQVLTRDLRVEPNTGFSASVTYWRGRYGFRPQVGFSRSTLRVGALPPTANPLSTLPAGATSVGVDTYFYDVRGAIGLLDYESTRWFWPYLLVGLGGITYDLKNPISPPLTFVGAAPVGIANAGNTIVVAGNGQQFVLGVNELSTQTVFALTFGIGTDFRIPIGGAGIAVRTEIADQLSPSPVNVRISNVAGAGFVPASTVDFPLVHQLSATVGLVVQIGR